ncbi:MAG TPA: VWA domain-containing protein, partial [Propionibacterium sp.]|nr:VWA domain-containing protein [Propionibacterium sp.]
MRKWGYAALALVLLLAPGLGGPRSYAAPAVSMDTVLLLMDLSGSMADRDKARNIKIEGAKTGVISLLDSLPNRARVGLMTYPGNGGCTAPTLRRAIAPLAEDNLGAQVSALPAPAGQTPTAEALRSAAETSRQSGGNATIVLVSDGLANCGEPPCPVAQSIAASGVPITVNTIGFDIDAKGAAELQCISDATGGSYVDVSEGSDLGAQIAQQMSPRLTIWANFPSGPVPVSSAGAVVRAQIKNESGVTATNVRVALTPQ